jgi:hypothetical protein
MIYCADLRCKYRNDKGKCISKKVNLSSWSVNTVNMGQKDFWECKSFEYDDKYIYLGKKMKELGIIDKLPFEEEE